MGEGGLRDLELWPVDKDIDQGFGHLQLLNSIYTVFTGSRGIVDITIGDRTHQTAGGLGWDIETHHVGEGVLSLGKGVVYDLLAIVRQLDGTRHTLIRYRTIIGECWRTRQE